MEYKNVIRVATKTDYKKYLSNIKDAKKALVKCNELVDKYGLLMKIIDVNYTFDREQLIFRFLIVMFVLLLAGLIFSNNLLVILSIV